MNYNSLINKPTINNKEIIGNNKASDIGGLSEEEMEQLLTTDLTPYYTKAQIDDLFSRSYVYREKSGNIVTFDCPSTPQNISEVTAEIVAVQTGNGDPSPTNVRPITGWSAVDVYVSGANLVDITSLTPIYALNGITYTINNDGSVVANGTATGRSQVYWSIPQDVAKTFTNKKLSGLKAHEGCSLFLELNGTPYTNYANDTGTGATIDSSIENANTTVNFVIRIADGTTVNNYVVIPRITDELQTITIQLGDTYYGGKLDVVSGTMTVERIFGEFDGVDENWTNIEAGSVGNRSNVLLNAFPSTDIDTDFVAICNTYIGRSYNDRTFNTSNVVWANPNGSLTVVTDSDIDTAEKFKALLQNTPLQVVVKLATPQTIQLTPTQVNSLLGVNNLWADSGDITVKALDKIIQE